MSSLISKPQPGTYPAGTCISIRASEPQAAVYYTLDGSQPSSASKRYRGPITLGPETTEGGIMRLRAIAVTGAGVTASLEADYRRAPGLVLRFRKPEDWSSAYLHYWGTEPDGLSTQWPGQAMTPLGDGWHSCFLPNQTFAGLVFSDARGAKTRDLWVDTEDVWFVGEERWDLDPARLGNFLFPGGASKALVVSMDDGRIQDRRLVKLLEGYGIRGTFHLNSGKLGHPGYLHGHEVASLYAAHEVSTHSVNHPYLTSLSRGEITSEIGDDLIALRRLSGQDVRGHAYPFGAYDEKVMASLQELGIAYARTGSATRSFRPPSNLLAWHPTCHHTAALELADAFLAEPDSRLSLFFVYGHSYELDSGEPQNDWSYMASLGARLGARADVWFATALGIADYIRAMRSVRSSLARDAVINPSGTELWLRAGAGVKRLPPGESTETHLFSSFR